MNFSLYLFGTPNGYNQYPADTNSQIFQEFYQKQQTVSQLTIFRSGQLVYYAYARRLSFSSSNNYFGICLIFNGIYCRNTKHFFDLFEKAYSEIALCGKILQIDNRGKVSITSEIFAHNQFEIERISLFFQNNLENHFSKDFAALSSSFKVGNGSTMLSVNDENMDILGAIYHYDCVYLSNDEKTDSELDRIHKMLSDLYSEKLDLNTKYKKLLGQKKQYKVVMLLLIVIIGCILGLVIFKNNLHRKESKIQALGVELTEKITTILNLRSEIKQMQTIQENLNKEVDKLKGTINNKNTIIDNKIEEIRNLNNKNSQLASKNSSLGRELRNLKNLNLKLSSEIANTKSLSIIKYKVIVPQSYCYRQCAGSYYKNDCYYSSGAVVDVYTQRDGYGLTIGGYLNMSELQKY